MGIGTSLVRKLVHNFDTTGNGEIDADEFAEMLSSEKRSSGDTTAPTLPVNVNLWIMAYKRKKNFDKITAKKKKKSRADCQVEQPADGWSTASDGCSNTGSIQHRFSRGRVEGYRTTGSRGVDKEEPMQGRCDRLEDELAYRKHCRVMRLHKGGEFNPHKPPKEDQILGLLEEHQQFLSKNKRDKNLDKFVERLSMEKATAATDKVMDELFVMREYPLGGGYALLDDDVRRGTAKERARQYL
jgi:hypothetical protein